MPAEMNTAMYYNNMQLVFCFWCVTCAPISHRLARELAPVHCGQHCPVQSAGPQALEVVGGDTGRHALILHDHAVVDEEHTVQIHRTGRPVPAHLQSVCAALITDPQLGDLRRD